MTPSTMPPTARTWTRTTVPSTMRSPPTPSTPTSSPTRRRCRRRKGRSATPDHRTRLKAQRLCDDRRRAPERGARLRCVSGCDGAAGRLWGLGDGSEERRAQPADVLRILPHPRAISPLLRVERDGPHLEVLALQRVHALRELLVDDEEGDLVVHRERPLIHVRRPDD